MRSALASLVALFSTVAVHAQDVGYNRDVRPILSEFCFHCHGPDTAQRKAKLDLSTPEGGRDALGTVGASAVLERVRESDPKRRMPPAGHAKAMTPTQIATLERWIRAGARYEPHWAFVPPTRPQLPKVADRDWCRNPLDHFVLARLEREGLKPAPEADRVTLLRRAALDLTGLPPTPEEVDAFLADRSARAYERAVERLLASPRYGERMAFRWLDAARYADTNGYQTDGPRTMWRWRDWVIDAFNANLPFDRFTVEQLAGDMLPNPTLEQRIATGFNRNHRGNSEGGVIPEEYAAEYVSDRVDTTATVWLGMTMGCAKCHNHKYDPIRQDEFYRMFALFNNVPEKGKAIKYGNSPPTIPAPTPTQVLAGAARRENLDLIEGTWRKQLAAIDRDIAVWEKTVDPAKIRPFVFGENIHEMFAFSEINDAAPRPFASNVFADDEDAGAFGFFDAFTVSVWANPGKKGGPLVTRMVNTDRADGYGLFLAEDGRVQVNLVKRWLDDAIRVETRDPIRANGWRHISFSYDGSRLASGVMVYVDGQPMPLRVLLDDLNQSFDTKEPLRVGAGGGRRFDGVWDDPRIYKAALEPDEIAVLANRDSIATILKTKNRTPVQTRKLQAYYLDCHAGDEASRLREFLRYQRRQFDAFLKSIPTTMVMEEMPTPRATHVLIRGEYDKKGPRVAPGVPAVWGVTPDRQPKDRLAFAKWVVDPKNPLTARVAVNRFWQMLFGQGIVRTTEDFGAQGEWPTHPELLDWLACEFMEPSLIDCCRLDEPLPSDWDMKHLLKTIVTSATYRQSSRAPAERWARDPDNRLFARGPRLRLPAEAIRDQALFVSGLLVEKIGGPSVRPYQPPGLEKELHGADGDARDTGPSLYRRSLYVHWKRTVAPPGLTTFDAANRETCVVRETRTNTPLQALLLLNDVAYVEAARALAARTLAEAKTPEERLTRLFRRVVCRAPTDAERAVLTRGLASHLTAYRASPGSAQRLLTVGDSPAPQGDPIETAAYAALANALLNLDEFVTKE